MVSTAQSLIRAFPGLPRLRYNIFAGTNSNAEWRDMWRTYVSRSPYDAVGEITEYERAFARATGTAYAISFGAGRMALYAILAALGIGPGDEVIIPAFTCVVVPNAILYRGALPVYVDVEPRTFNIDVGRVEDAITQRTKAILAQHTFGVPCDVEALRAIGKRHGLPVIEDAAHALGATHSGRPAGSLTDVAFFSTDRSKVINTYLGGMATTNDPELAARIRSVQVEAPFFGRSVMRRLIRSFLAEYACFAPRALWLGRAVYGLIARTPMLFNLTDELRTEMPTDYPYPSRLSSVQARLGLSQLALLEQNLGHRRKIARWLEERIGWLGKTTDAEMEASAWLRYSFLVKDREVFEHAFRKHFDLGTWFTSVVEGRSERLDLVGYRAGSCPVAEHCSRHIVNFPTHPRIPARAIRNEVNRNWSLIEEQIHRSVPA